MQEQSSTLRLEQTFWCSSAKYPEWKTLPFSAFDREHDCPDRMLEFRTELSYAGQGACLLRFTGGCRFRLLINGNFAEDGPVETGGDYLRKEAPDWWFYEERDFSGFLHAGKNELLFQMIPAGMCQMDYSLGFGWLWCAVKRENHWQAIPAGKWQFRINPFYRNRIFLDFRQPETRWENDCVPVTLPFPVQSLGLPPLTSKLRRDFRLLFPFGKGKNIRSAGKSVRITTGDPHTFYLEFPEERCGHFEVFWSGDHEAILHLEFQELFGVAQNLDEKIHLAGSSGSYRTIYLYPFRYVKVTVTPSFFFCENNENPLTLSFQLYERHFPVGKKKSLSSFPLSLRKIDDLCSRNIVMCMQRMHLDSPVHQEGLGCVGDYRIEALAEYALFGESRLAKADLLRIAMLLRKQGKLFHTLYELSYILMSREYADFTGDQTLLASCYDVLRQIYERFHAFTGPTGLISEAENYLFIDWITTGKYTFHHPPAHWGTGVMTAHWYGALHALARIAETLKKKEDQALYLAESEAVRCAMNRELWDGKNGCYRDGIPGLSRRKPNEWLPEEDGRESSSSLTSIMALAYGVPTSKEKPESLLKRVVEGKLPLRPTVFYMFYLFEAVERYGKWEEYGEKLLLQWSVFEKTGVRESWTSGDYSHAAGCSPAIFLRRHLCRGKTNGGKDGRATASGRFPLSGKK